MKTNLSSQIKLDRVPKKYYRPDSALELTALSRFEKIFTDVHETAEDGAVYVAKSIADIIGKCAKENRKCVMALGWGTGTHLVYHELVEMYKAGKLWLTATITVLAFTGMTTAVKADDQGTSTINTQQVIAASNGPAESTTASASTATASSATTESAAVADSAVADCRFVAAGFGRSVDSAGSVDFAGFAGSVRSVGSAGSAGCRLAKAF